MPEKLRIAAIQMRSTYGEVAANLTTAEGLIRSAASEGAKLVVLPELFNTGYGYTSANYNLAENRDGRTYTWLTRLAVELDIHLAGSFLLHKDGEIFNTLLLAAPDGQTWEYDKTHPWGWERAYFCPGKGPLIAETRLGKIGMLICYDAAFPSLFAAYAGKIQLLLVSSCPPKVNRITLSFPNGRRIPVAETNPISRATQESSDHLFDADLRAQSAWLGVPLVNAMPYGQFESAVPRPKLSFGSFAAANPRLWGLLRQAERATVSADYNQHTLIAAGDGSVLARPSEGDSYAIAAVEIPVTPPLPTTPQPKMKLRSLARWASSFLSWLVVREYKKSR